MEAYGLAFGLAQTVRYSDWQLVRKRAVLYAVPYN